MTPAAAFIGTARIGPTGSGERRGMRQSISFIGALMGLAIAASMVHAGEYYSIGTSPLTNNNWDAGLNNWTSDPAGTPPPTNGGANPTTYANHNFNIITNGIIRTNSGSATFSGSTSNGATLTLAGGTVQMRGSDSSIKTAASVIGAGTTSKILFSDSKTITTAITLSVTSFNNTTGATTFIDLGTGSTSSTVAEVSKLSIGTLTGGGNFAVMAANGQGANQSRTLQLSATTASAFTGNITWSGTNKPILKFGNGLVSGGGLIASDASSRILLDQNVTFASVTLNGSPLAIGTYTFAGATGLNALYDTLFVDGGSGSITVAGVPEPSMFAVASMVLLPILSRRRRRVQ
jgi:hypothetical protein